MSNVRLKDQTGNNLYPVTYASNLLKSTGAKYEIYPVGAIYISYGSTSPASLFGGTWQKLPAGTFLMSAGGSYTVGQRGGAATHTLTDAEMPRHNHGQALLVDGDWSDVPQVPDRTVLFTTDDTSVRIEWSATSAGCASFDGNGTNYSGQGQAHNNLPPYYAVNMWRRTA